MIMTGVRAAAALAFLSAPLSFAAAEDAGKLGDQVAPEISEIASGGHWSADGKGGFYRAFVVMAGENGGTAEVYLQWVSFGDGKPAVVKSLPVKEVNEQKLGNASITIGGEDDKENETTISHQLLRHRRGQGHLALREGYQSRQLYDGESAARGRGRKEKLARKTAARARTRPQASRINPVTGLSRSALRAFASCANKPSPLFDG